jgi:FKBP-type peptidyl-prolyl cis-trans isomerase SlyD
MYKTNLTIADDMVVSLIVTMRLDEDPVILPSQEQKPVIFLQGHGQIIPGVERILYGLAINDEKRIVVDPVDGFGKVDLTNARRVPRSAFSPDRILHLGEELQVRVRSGQILDAYVTTVEPDSVLLDFNHPLAGETLFIHVKVVGLRAATLAELDHGYV